VKVIKGRIFIDTEMFGEMDPYVEIYHNGKHYKTVLAKNGGKRPTWNASLEI
jgi:Ca2+-dependent lipid-binding protein